MELLYIWIEDFKNIKRQGFNLSPKHWFEFTPTEPEGKVTGGTLTHEIRNTDYPDNFFGENISNITAIIGKSGSGKSNLMEYLCIDPFYHRSASFVVFGDRDQLIIDSQEKLTIICDPDFNVKFSNEDYFYDSNIKRVYYCGALVNISSSSDVENISKFHRITSSSKSSYLTSLAEDTYAQARFLINYRKEFRELLGSHYFYIPNTIKFELKREKRIDPLLEIIYDAFRTPNSKPIENAFFHFKCIIVAKHIEENIYNWTTYEKLKEKPEGLIQKVELIIKELPQKEFNVFLGKLNELKSSPNNLDEKIQKLDSLLRKTNNFHFYTNPKLSGIEDSFYYEFTNSSNTEFFPFKEFLDEMIDLNGNNDYFDFSWKGLSFGEDQLLLIFAKLFNAFERFKEENFHIFLDEAELGIHPSWQIKYISLLSNLLNCFAHKFQKKCQVLITSHSPLLISDLPKSNIIFLGKNEITGNCIVRDPDDISQTFGANIHSLYRSSFFLENGFVGEFAKQKIDWVIKLLNEDDRKKIEENKQEINFIIKNIGEPLLRNKLSEMYNGGKTVEDRIQALEEEIKQLKSLKGDKNDPD